jgi:enterochelin esterase-like enzyme
MIASKKIFADSHKPVPRQTYNLQVAGSNPSRLLPTLFFLHSHVLDEYRLLLIHLPRQYGDTQSSYPVLYLLYGQDINNYFAEAVIITEKHGSTGEISPVIIVEQESPRIPCQCRPERGASISESIHDSFLSI